eukprot:CAMPEP_0174929082 /NCGR_PEP_ID=MMETSP1355-20121228/27014_1 /TAXON_ID=464990 /ORGANISM="Hemiselmis tepida, Strain CCMP443" /LENGTH=293 /DNA_ID=CAMNT_0016175267 /DNA_START=10 /DNA_END=891 /DNA_ORIENTATION=+
MMRVLLVASLAVAAGAFSPSSFVGLRGSSAAVAASKGGLAGRGASLSGLRMQDLDAGNDLTAVGRRNLEDLEGKWSKIGVLGGSKGVGKEIVKRLSGMGVEVKALVRTEEAKKELEGMPGVSVVVGDALEATDVCSALNGCDAAISTLGGDQDSQKVDYTGNMNMIENAGIIGVTRMILVTSVGTGDSKDALPEPAYNAMEKFLTQKTKAENLLLKYYTNTDYTIIRPGGLKSEAATGKAILTEDKMAVGSVTREDVADLCIEALYSKTASQKVLTCVDPSQSDKEGPVPFAL